MRILIIDDEDLIRKCLSRVALSRGHIVQAESNGRSGLKTWKEFQPHLVFLDVLMPFLDGPSVLKAAKKNNEKVIMMSAHRAFSDGLSISGVDLFVSKPFQNIVAVFDQAERLCLSPELSV